MMVKTRKKHKNKDCLMTILIRINSKEIRSFKKT